ncbi:hypothetical protein [Pseudacidovorax intermedius]|uniref:hypothetical protein n=1 Tax=Pseudacidovorax intermedius TaxID=433924 RepID=UPI0018CACC07|nr:hypothetical protein [Pseudacidovorax intermedius]
MYNGAGELGAVGLGEMNPVWTPELLPGLLEAWQSEAGVTADVSNDVSAWTGLKGISASAAAGVRPNRSRAMAGKTGLVFAGDLMKTGAALSTVAAPVCAFIVWDMLTDLDDTQQCVMSCDAINVFLNFPAAGNAFLVNGNNPNGNIGWAGPAVGRHVLVYYQPASGSAVLRVDGVQVATKAAGVVDRACGALRFGRYYGEADNTAVVDTAIGAAGLAAGVQALLDVQKLEGYLAQGWCASGFLPAGHPYRTTVPRKLT